MHSILMYAGLLVKYIIVSLVVGFIVGIFSRTIGLIVFVVLLLGSFLAAKDDVKKKMVEEEMRGFDEQMKLTRRSLQ